MYIKVLKNRIVIIHDHETMEAIAYIKMNNLGLHLVLEKKVGMYSRNELLEKYKKWTLQDSKERIKNTYY